MRTSRSALVVACLAIAACHSASRSGSSPSSAAASSSAATSGSSSAAGAGGSASSSATSGSGVSSGSGGAATASSSSASGSSSGAGGSALAGWTLTWSDEFNGADNSDVDPTKWVHVESGNGNGNQELEYYTSGPANAYQAGGYLHIVAQTAGAAAFSCWYGQCQYTSGKIVTKADGQAALFQQEYGRFAARMKIPAGQGMWPAFWMLGSNIDTVSWPTCGEIDAMENIGKDPATVYGTLHGPGASASNVSLGGNTMISAGALSDDFHEYAVEWQAGQVVFLLDEVPYFTGAQAQFGGSWVFDQPFYLILNLAIGGSWPGSPDATTVFPAELLVDWVRVYQPAP